MSDKIVLNHEEKDLELLDVKDLEISLKEDSFLRLRILNINSKDNIKITAEVGSNSKIEVIYADFSDNDSNLDVKMNLVGEGAYVDWKLATLTHHENKKVFDISFNHLKPNTISYMDNYGVSKDKSSIVFSGCNHIFEHCYKSETKQNAKIIVFDEEASGVASPILKIDENDVKASHGAVVGQLNNDHMFYLMSRGLSQNEAKQLITLGYLKPISVHFSEENQNKIIDAIRWLS